MARTNPLQFIQQVRAETAKVVWPTRRETMLTTVMVMIMATLFATFFFSVDLLIRFGLEAILNSPLESVRPEDMGALLGRNAARANSAARPFSLRPSARRRQEGRRDRPPEELG